MITRPPVPNEPVAPSASRQVDEPAAPTHACLRCGAPISLADALCQACNPAGLEQPAASQAHGTVFGGIALAVAAMVVAGFVFLGGVGPFSAMVAAAAPSDAGLRLTLSVENQGTRDGAATCRVWDPSWFGTPARETFVRTPTIAAGTSITFDQVVHALGTRAGSFAVECTR